MNKTDDNQHLHLLSIFHYIIAGITALIACFPLIHFTVGIGIIIESLINPKQFDGFHGFLFGLMFAGIAGSFILLGWALAVCMAITGIFLARRKRYIFCLVIAGIECAFTPFGTVLGVFTIITLVRPTVKALFIPTAAEIPQTV